MASWHTVTIEGIEAPTPDVGRFVTSKPENHRCQPGQATSEDNRKDEWRPFTFTFLPYDPKREFTIKIYPKHDGVTADGLSVTPSNFKPHAFHNRNTSDDPPDQTNPSQLFRTPRERMTR